MNCRACKGICGGRVRVCNEIVRGEAEHVRRLSGNLDDCSLSFKGIDIGRRQSPDSSLTIPLEDVIPVLPLHGVNTVPE